MIKFYLTCLIFSFIIFAFSCTKSTEKHNISEFNDCVHKDFDTISYPKYHYPFDSIFVDLSHLKINDKKTQMNELQKEDPSPYLFTQFNQNCKTYRWCSSVFIRIKKHEYRFQLDSNEVKKSTSMKIIDRINDSLAINFIVEFQSKEINGNIPFPNSISIYKRQESGKWLLYDKVKVKNMNEYKLLEKNCVFLAHIPSPSDKQKRDYPNIMDWESWHDE